jgi:hypothetical protein
MQPTHTEPRDRCFSGHRASQTDTTTIGYRGFKSTRDVSLVIDGRNTANPLIDYTARPDEEWRHLPNNTDKIDGTHFQESEYFYPGVRTKAVIGLFFFQTHFYWLLSMREIYTEENAIHHNPAFEIQRKNQYILKIFKQYSGSG